MIPAKCPSCDGINFHIDLDDGQLLCVSCQEFFILKFNGFKNVWLLE